MSYTNLRPMAVVLSSVMLLQGCATGPNLGNSSISKSIKNTFNNDDPCSNNKRNIGIALGAIAGALIATQVADKKNRAAGVLIGAAAGAGLGGFIGYELDKRRCEISKIEKKFNANISVIPLNSANGADNTKKTAEVGLSVNVIDKTGESQFETGSDAIKSNAREMFTELAKQYALKTDVKENTQLNDATKSRRVLLIGHTDDTGGTNKNAELSERRAKNVAEIFKLNGVPIDNIFYQGAGETMPYADNATAEGRSQNRRVEIVDLTNEDMFESYVNNKRPNTAFYRDNTEQKSDLSKNKVKVITEKIADKTTDKKVTKAASAAKEKTTDKSKNEVFFDFGGKPFTSQQAKIDTGSLVQSNAKFSLISSAQASDITRIETCNVDRPRNFGLVKSLKDGSAYRTTDFLPGLYGRTWYDTVGGNLVVLNNVKVLRNGAKPANKPELKIYKSYSPATNGKEPKPDVFITPDVNTYQTTNGLLYRVFANSERGVNCLDILMPNENNNAAKQGKLIYAMSNGDFVADIKPKLK